MIIITITYIEKKYNYVFRTRARLKLILKSTTNFFKKILENYKMYTILDVTITNTNVAIIQNRKITKVVIMYNNDNDNDNNNDNGNSLF